MIPVTILLAPSVVDFYRHVADAVGYPLDQVLSDALFKLAGELSLEALQHVSPRHCEEGNFPAT